ncbi:MAG: hypothetical protein ABI662_09230 [Dermatophilaceae bacterium]
MASMASMAPEAAQTLGALTTATVFSAGFLSTRVHRERGRAIDRVTKLDEQVATAIRGKEPLDANWFDGQVEALNWSLRDGLDRLVLGLNIALGVGVIGLAGAAGVTGEVAWGASQGVLLIAYAVTAFAVITIGTLDVVLARREVKRRYGTTAVGQMNQADSLMPIAIRHPTSKKSKQLRDTGELAVRYSHGLYGPAWAILGYAHLLSMTTPGYGVPHLLFAERALERAVGLGPETAPMRAALAAVYEVRGDYERAAANWVRALWIYHEAVRPLAYADESVAPRPVQLRASGFGRLPQEGVPSLEGPYSWRFAPGMPLTLSLALDQLPPYRSAALLTAEMVMRKSSSFPDSNETVIESLVRWLECWMQPEVWQLADARATALLKIEGAPEVLAAIAKFRSPEGQIGQARQSAESAQSARDAKVAEILERSHSNQEKMGYIIQNMKGSEARILEDEDRIKRLGAGQGTAEDLEWEQRAIDEALKEATPEEIARQRADIERQQQRMAKQKATGKRKRMDDEEWSRTKANLHRSSRLSQGLATEEDLAATPFAQSEGTPWPEPVLTRL